jgi:hypothetical protein
MGKYRKIMCQENRQKKKLIEKAAKNKQLNKTNFPFEFNKKIERLGKFLFPFLLEVFMRNFWKLFLGETYMVDDSTIFF